MRHIVYIIFGDCPKNIAEYASHCHLWLENTELNLAIAKEYWNKNKDKYFQNKGITLFDNVGIDKAIGLYQYIATVNEHHQGQYEVLPPWDEIIAFGAGKVDREKISFGFEHEQFYMTFDDDHVSIRRRPPQPL